ncbi:metal-dependent hydrolase [Candidatus Magnetobacterium bavaricum]|uniref:Metal-dependent hydrolase n=1 Tax=Candidatus Magnetobacterium bavaricum TaxID=29290 RepID=A0A0F3GLY3_9BACT|nr:metal-dependent hydrolase [Candidatus Magnetobacterium bavaricum]
MEFCRGCDVLFHDSEYVEGEYNEKITWGHSVYKDSLRLALEAGVKQFGLFHHNQNRTDDAQDEIVADCHRIIREKNSPLQCLAISQGLEFTL